MKNLEQKYHFVVTRYCPTELLFDGMMSFSEAHKFMDENASFERRVGFKVFNDSLCRWEDYKDSYFGERRLYDNKGCLYVLDPDYSRVKLPENQLWHLWFVSNDGVKMFIQSFKTKECANKLCSFLSSELKEGIYFVEPSDIKIDGLC